MNSKFINYQDDHVLYSPHLKQHSIEKQDYYSQYGNSARDGNNNFKRKSDNFVESQDSISGQLRDYNLTQHSDQEKTIDDLKSRIHDLKKQLKHTQRQNSQLQIDMQEEKKNITIEKEIERKRLFQDDFQKQVIKIGKISEKCDDLNREQRYQNDLIKQKNEEIRNLLQENEQLRRVKKDNQEQAIKIESIEEENRQMKEKVKNLQEEMNKFQGEKKESQQKLKDEMIKIKVENVDLMETINNQLVELSDCINITNKYKEIILSQQKNIEISNKTISEANEIIIGLDDLVKSITKKKNSFLTFQGDSSSSTYDILYILKNNILSVTKLFQEIKQSKKKYKNKFQLSNEEIKDLKETQKYQRAEIEQLKTENLLLQQQFDQTVILMEQQINERNIEEMRLKQQLIDITNKIADLQREFDEYDSKKYQEISCQLGSYVHALHCKTAKLLNQKQICGSFVSGYVKLLDKMNVLASDLSISYTNSNLSVKQKALKKLKKVLKVVFFSQILKSRRSILKIDISTVNQIIKNSQKYQYKVQKIDLQLDVNSLINGLSVQSQEYYRYTISQQQSTKVLSSIEQNTQLKISNKDNEIDLVKQKFEKLNQELQQFANEKELVKNQIEELRKKNFELEFESKRLQEENFSLNEQLKFHRQYFIQEKNAESAKLPSQENFYQSVASSKLNNTDGFTQNYEISNQLNNLFSRQSNGLNKLQIQNLNSQDLKSKNQHSNQESYLNSPILNNNYNNKSNSNLGSFDFLKFQQSLANSNQKQDTIRNNIYVEQEQKEQSEQNIQTTDKKKQAYQELKKQQQILEQKLSSNQNEIEKIRTNSSQLQSRTASKRQSVDLIQDSFKFNTQQFSNQLNNQKNTNHFSSQSINNQFKQSNQSLNSENYYHLYPKASLSNNNYTFNNNSSAQIIYSDSQRKARTIQDQLKQELYESQKFSKFLTQQE